jgi:YhcH/YjgK/YiaL family protein
MIIDNIKNAKLYSNISERINKALEYITATDFANVNPGIYKLDGDNMYASVSFYHTKDKTESYPEAHQKYIDVQYIIEGCELIGYATLQNQEIEVGYNDEKDIAFYNCKTTYLKMETGMFMILFPTDLHQPCIMEKESTYVKKVVVKVKL